MTGFLERFYDPRVRDRLLVDEGEYIVDEVYKHPMAIMWPIVGLVLCLVLFGSLAFAGSLFWLPLIVGLVLFIWSLCAIHIVHMDRFVVTNMRVFRVHGVLNQHLATMPLMRILDISVEEPLLGQLTGYGNFVFESAAQDQGLRDIKYVGRPRERDLLIQRVIQRSGIRAHVSGAVHDDDET